jgi:adenine deaminase
MSRFVILSLIFEIGPFKDMKNHPIDELYKRGVKVTINCDDPAYLSSDICENFLEVVETFNWTKLDILKVIQNSVEASFMSEQEKNQFNQNLKEFLK